MPSAPPLSPSCIFTRGQSRMGGKGMGGGCGPGLRTVQTVGARWRLALWCWPSPFAKAAKTCHVSLHSLPEESAPDLKTRLQDLSGLPRSMHGSSVSGLEVSTQTCCRDGKVKGVADAGVCRGFHEQNVVPCAVPAANPGSVKPGHPKPEALSLSCSGMGMQNMPKSTGGLMPGQQPGGLGDLELEIQKSSGSMDLCSSAILSSSLWKL